MSWWFALFVGFPLGVLVGAASAWLMMRREASDWEASDWREDPPDET